MTIQLPKHTSPDTGLSRIRGIWRAAYFDGATRRYKSLGTRDLAEARTRRDRLYGGWLAQGAVHRGGGVLGRPPRNGPPENKIRWRKPWTVHVAGRYISSHATEEEAREMLATLTAGRDGR